MTPLVAIARQKHVLLLLLWSLCWHAALGFAPPSLERQYASCKQQGTSSITRRHAVLSIMDPSSYWEAGSTTLTLTSEQATPALLSDNSLSAMTAVELGGVPALLMLFFTVIGLKIKTSPVLVGALQHFAAGILLSTIAIELLPEMMNATGLQENVASGAGFFLGVAVLIGLGVLLPQEETTTTTSSSSSFQTEDQASQEPHTALCQSLRNRQQSYKKEAFCCACQMEEALLEADKLLPMNVFRNDKASLLVDEQASVTSSSDVAGAVQPATKTEAWMIEKQPSSFPTALVTAIAIDSALDGLLIGIAIAAGPSTGPMLSASLSVEMSFLGLTLAAALYGRSLSESFPAAVLGPSLLLLGACAGGALATTLADSPVLLAGLLGFGTSSLLFMVAEELLLEAHEEGEHVWWSDLQLYTGFFASILVDKFVLAA